MKEDSYLERKDVSTDEISIIRLVARCKDENNFAIQMDNYRDKPSFPDVFKTRK